MPCLYPAKALAVCGYASQDVHSGDGQAATVSEETSSVIDLTDF